jgi:hypothetical protein
MRRVNGSVLTASMRCSEKVVLSLACRSSKPHLEAGLQAAQSCGNLPTTAPIASHSVPSPSLHQNLVCRAQAGCDSAGCERRTRRRAGRHHGPHRYQQHLGTLMAVEGV